MRSIIFVLLVSLSSTYGSECGDISGQWINELGSLMTIEHRPLNRITGEYNTAVETFKGAAELVSNLTGTFLPVSDGALIGFSVLFNRGASLTSWVGQCIVCDGEEKLFTTWVLRRHTEAPKKWMITNVHQNTFTRIDKDAYSSHYSKNRISSRRPESIRSDIEDRIKGQWISGSGDKLNISAHSEPGLFTGSNSHSEIIGHSDGNENFAALGFVSPLSSKKFKVWTGHLYESGTEKKLETSWLTHEFKKDCQNPRHLVQFGVDHYSHAGKTEGSVPKEESFLEKIKNFFRSIF